MSKKNLVPRMNPTYGEACCEGRYQMLLIGPTLRQLFDGPYQDFGIGRLK